MHNAYLFKEWQELRGRVDAFEGLMMARGAGGAEGARFGLGGVQGYHYSWPLGDVGPTNRLARRDGKQVLGGGTP